MGGGERRTRGSPWCARIFGLRNWPPGRSASASFPGLCVLGPLPPAASGSPRESRPAEPARTGSGSGKHRAGGARAGRGGAHRGPSARAGRRGQGGGGRKPAAVRRGPVTSLGFQGSLPEAHGSPPPALLRRLASSLGRHSRSQLAGCSSVPASLSPHLSPSLSDPVSPSSRFSALPL